MKVILLFVFLFSVQSLGYDPSGKPEHIKICEVAETKGLVQGRNVLVCGNGSGRTEIAAWLDATKKVVNRYEAYCGRVKSCQGLQREVIKEDIQCWKHQKNRSQYICIARYSLRKTSEKLLGLQVTSGSLKNQRPGSPFVKALKLKKEHKYKEARAQLVQALIDSNTEDDARVQREIEYHLPYAHINYLIRLDKKREAIKESKKLSRTIVEKYLGTGGFRDLVKFSRNLDLDSQTDALTQNVEGSIEVNSARLELRRVLKSFTERKGRLPLKSELNEELNFPRYRKFKIIEYVTDGSSEASLKGVYLKGNYPFSMTYSVKKRRVIKTSGKGFQRRMVGTLFSLGNDYPDANYMIIEFLDFASLVVLDGHKIIRRHGFTEVALDQLDWLKEQLGKTKYQVIKVRENYEDPSAFDCIISTYQAHTYDFIADGLITKDKIPTVRSKYLHSRFPKVIKKKSLEELKNKVKFLGVNNFKIFKYPNRRYLVRYENSFVTHVQPISQQELDVLRSTFRSIEYANFSVEKYSRYRIGSCERTTRDKAKNVALNKVAVRPMSSSGVRTLFSNEKLDLRTEVLMERSFVCKLIRKNKFPIKLTTNTIARIDKENQCDESIRQLRGVFAGAGPSKARIRNLKKKYFHDL